METRADYVMVGTFVLALLVGVVVAILWLARVQFTHQSEFYDIYFTGSVTGLTEGSVVRYNGIPVGRVASIQLDPQNPQRVRVAAEITTNTIVKSDAVASLELQGLTGGAFIEIAGGSSEAGPLARQDGERYPVIASVPSGLQRVVSSAPEALTRLISVADRLADILDERNRAAISETLENLRRVSAVTAGRANDIDATIGDSAAAVRELRASIASLDQTVGELRQMLSERGDLRNTLRSVDETSRKVGDLAAHADALVQEDRPSLREFSQGGLSQLRQLVSDTRNLVAQLTRIADGVERDPSRLLYGDRRSGYQPP